MQNILRIPNFRLVVGLAKEVRYTRSALQHYTIHNLAQRTKPNYMGEVTIWLGGAQAPPVFSTSPLRFLRLTSPMPNYEYLVIRNYRCTVHKFIRSFLQSSRASISMNSRLIAKATWLSIRTELCGRDPEYELIFKVQYVQYRTLKFVILFRKLIEKSSEHAYFYDSAAGGINFNECQAAPLWGAGVFKLMNTHGIRHTTHNTRIP